ncbi:MAG: 5-oxoprolinase subunit PxpB [Acidobacteria bacterium]|jgi:inhibitor of KinA|nr:5-oxoprolinase subunit PxpB [Acidobacteriota bacterium]
MIEKNIKIFPLGDNALTISFGNEISPELNNRVLKLADYCSQNSFLGFIEIVSAYASLSVFYDVLVVRKNFSEFSTAFEAVKNFAENALRNLNKIPEKKPRLIEIPVSFDKKFALDLEFVALTNNLTPDEVVGIFTAQTYRVYMLGFLPGFAYMGEVDEKIAAPRKTSPRLKVPKGSVGIAGRQTGIYSLESPGGWQIIGKTKVELFTPEAESPTFLQAGDLVKFYAVN